MEKTIMEINSQGGAVSKKLVWTGRVISGLCVLLFIFDGGTKVIKVPAIMQEAAKQGFTENMMVGIGAALLVSTLIYVIPQTAVLGAILLTGYLGGAIAVNVRFNAGMFPIAMAFFIAVLTWLGICLRDPRLWAFIPIRQ